MVLVFGERAVGTGGQSQVVMSALPESAAPAGSAGRPPDSLPRTAALRWFAAAYLLILGMSFLILPRGPINPLYGLVWLRGPFFILSGLALLWLCSLHLSRRATVVAHVLAALPPLVVAVQYVTLQAYSPAVTLLLLGLAVALSPLAPPRPVSSSWRPDALGLVLGLSLAAQGIDLLARPQPEVIPYGLYHAMAVTFLVFGLAVAGCHLATRIPKPVCWVAHAVAGASLLALWVILALGVASIFWVLNAPVVLAGAVMMVLPWLSRRMVLLDADTVRARLAISLFSGSLVTLLIAVPVVLALRDSGGQVADSTRQAAFGVTLGLSIAAALAGWLLARQLVVPLSRLVAGVERIATGVRPVTLTSSAPREIEELAVAVQSMAARLDEQAAREERSRLARDLHDSITQALFAAALKAESLAHDEAVPAHSAATVEQVRRLTRGALAQMRVLLFELRSESLEDVPIEQLLRNVAEAAEGRGSMVVELTLRGEGEPPPELHTALYRVTQEALNNVARHSGATRARVELEIEPSRLRLLVQDNGCGFEPSPLSRWHFGLRSMQERATEAGAHLRLVSAPGEGTLVILDWCDDKTLGADPCLA
jgi:signal transduction histidine kinase